MDNSILFRVLRTLSAEESKIVTQFLTIPFFNDGPRKQKNIAMWQYLQLHHSKKILERDVVCHELQLKNHDELRKITTELLSVVRKAILHIAAANQTDTQKHIMLTPVYIHRGLQFEFEKSEDKAIEHREKSKKNDLTYYQEGWQMAVSRFEYEGNLRSTNDLNLPNVTEQLDICYFTNKLMTEARLLIFGAILPIEHKSTYAELTAFIRHSLGEKLKNYPLITFLLDIIEVIRAVKPTPIKKFEELINQLRQCEATFSLGLLSELHSYLRSYCSLAINKGASHNYNNLYFQLIKEHSEKNTIYENGLVTSGTLHTMITLGLRLGQTQWALDTLENHRHRIKSDDSEQIYKHNLAKCLFHLGKFQAAVDTLPSVFTDYQTEVTGKIIRIMCYYELQSPLLEYALETFHINDAYRRMKRGEITKIHYSNINNFVIVIKALISLSKGNQKKMTALLQQLDDPEFYVAERVWLREKIATLVHTFA